MRTLLIAVAVLILVIVGAGVYFAMNLDRTVKSAVESVGPEYAGTDVTLDSVKLSLLDGTGELRGLTVGQPDGYEGDASVRIASVRIALDPASLLEDTIVIRELLIDGAQINAIVKGPRANNLQAILDHVASVTGPAAAPDESAPGKKVIIDRFSFTGAAASAAVTGLAPIRVSVPDVVLDDVGRASNGATIGSVLQQVLRPVVGAIVRSAAEGRLGDLLDSAKGDLGTRLKEGASGVMDKLKGLSPFGQKDAAPQN